jgi:hypothetical protein
VKLVFLLALIGYFIFALCRSVAPVVDAHKAANWPVVTGTVLASRVEAGCGRGAHFPFVQYSYQYSGQAYVGHQIAFGNVGCGSVSSAAEVIRGYTAGMNLQVHIDPADPATSVLMTGGVFWGTWGTIALLLALLAAFVFEAVREWPRRL